MACLDNLAVALDEHFDERAASTAREIVLRAGYTLDERESADERTLSWIDMTFGGTWSREAFVGKNVIARREGAPMAFATYAPQGLRFRWLRDLGVQPGVGIFGPFGVDPKARGSVVGPALLTLALYGLRRLGYERGLIPAVSSERLGAYYARACGAVLAERFDLEDFKRTKARTVVMASGEGTTFAALAESVARGGPPLDLRAVVVGLPSAGVRAKTQRAGIEECVVAWDRAHETREQYDARLREAVARFNPEVVLLLGWMHVLDAAFIHAFAETLNLHPAFLPFDPASNTVTMPDGTEIPAFRGTRCVRDAVAAGKGWYGASVHRVTERADRGEIIMRVPLRLEARDDEISAYARLRPVERALVTRAVTTWSYER